MVSFAGVNWLAVLVGVVASNALGFLWYGPLFGKTWLSMIGKKQEELKSSPSMYAVTALASAITMVVLSLIVHAFGGWERFPFYNVYRSGNWYDLGFLIGAGSPLLGVFGRKNK